MRSPYGQRDDVIQRRSTRVRHLRTRVHPSTTYLAYPVVTLEDVVSVHVSDERRQLPGSTPIRRIAEPACIRTEAARHATALRIPERRPAPGAFTVKTAGVATTFSRQSSRSGLRALRRARLTGTSATGLPERSMALGTVGSSLGPRIDSINLAGVGMRLAIGHSRTFAGRLAACFARRLTDLEMALVARPRTARFRIGHADTSKGVDRGRGWSHSARPLQLLVSGKSPRRALEIGRNRGGSVRTGGEGSHPPPSECPRISSMLLCVHHTHASSSTVALSARVSCWAMAARACSMGRFPRTLLHHWCAARRLRGSRSAPPRLTGTMWSAVSAPGCPHRWQMPPSLRTMRSRRRRQGRPDRWSILWATGSPHGVSRCGGGEAAGSFRWSIRLVCGP